MIDNMEINILIDEPFTRYLDAGWLELVAERVIDAQGVGSQTEMGLVITGQERVRGLNRKYMGRDMPTDVIAFHMGPVDEGDFIQPPDGFLHLGEVVISYPQAVIQADQEGHSIGEEIAILVIHGILHLLGFRDDNPDLKQIMAQREAEILCLIGDITNNR
jgi:probable rRNA maturation factor